MKLCPKCGYSNEEFDTVCSGCGSSLNSENEPNTYGSVNPPAPAKTNSFAIASLVLGIVTVPLICCCGAGILTGILAVVFGFMAKNKIKASMGAEKGDGMALAGIILGFAGIGLGILVLVLQTVGVVSSPEFWEGFEEGLNEGLNQ